MEIDTTQEKYNAYEIILKCKDLASDISAKDLLNLDKNTAIKIMDLIKHLKSLELQIIEFEPNRIEA
jgi:hypothetical protein